MCYEVPGAARAGTGIPHHGSVSGQQVPGAARAGTRIPHYGSLTSQEDLSLGPGLIQGSRWRQIPPAPVQAGLRRGLRSNHLLWRCIGGVDLQVALEPLSAETSELY